MQIVEYNYLSIIYCEVVNHLDIIYIKHFSMIVVWFGTVDSGLIWLEFRVIG